MKRLALVLTLAVSAMAATAGVALAEDARVLRDSNVYENRFGNHVVNEVDRGDIVNVRECSRRADRCRIRIPGEDGWINASRLAFYDDDDDKYVPFSFGLGFGNGYGGFSIQINP